ncbi:MAG: ISKra4 family transposase [Acidimicrobiales bacterium]
MVETPTAGLEALMDLEAFLAEAADARLSMGEIERAAEAKGRELLRRVLQAHLDGRGRGEAGEAIVVDDPSGPLRLSYKRSHTRTLLTIFGEVSLTRIGYGAPGHPSIHPLDTELGLPGRMYSYEVCRRLVRASVLGPFDEAIVLLGEMTGTKIPKRAAEQIVAEAAADFDSFYAGRAAAKPGRAEVLVGSVDGKGIPMVKSSPVVKVVRRKKGEKPNKKRMATVGTVHSQAPRPRTPQEVLDSLFATPGQARAHHPRQARANRRVWASLEATKDVFIADVKAEMCRRDPKRRHPWVIVTDGERALQRRVRSSFEDVTLVLDLFHALEKLWPAAYVFHPEGSPEAEAFVKERALRILSGQVSQVVKGLRQMATKHQLRGEKAKAVRGAADYFYANRAHMAYDRYLAAGWPIGSGSVEAACKCLVRDRMERSGMRWVPGGAEAMLKLRAVYLSGDLDEYWRWHIQQDQQRLYGSWRLVAE